jgi:hypothetical protein
VTVGLFSSEQAEFSRFVLYESTEFSHIRAQYLDRKNPSDICQSYIPEDEMFNNCLLDFQKELLSRRKYGGTGYVMMTAVMAMGAIKSKSYNERIIKEKYKKGSPKREELKAKNLLHQSNFLMESNIMILEDLKSLYEDGFERQFTEDYKMTKGSLISELEKNVCDAFTMKVLEKIGGISSSVKKGQDKIERKIASDTKLTPIWFIDMEKRTQVNFKKIQELKLYYESKVDPKHLKKKSSY